MTPHQKAVRDARAQLLAMERFVSDSREQLRRAEIELQKCQVRLVAAESIQA